MSIKERIKGFWQRTARFFRRLWNGRHTISDLVKHKHRFVVLDTDTYKEKISFQLSGINIFVFLGVTALVLVFLTALLLAFTPLREFIPGYSNARMTEQTYANARMVDSLSVRLHQQEELLADIQDVMMGRDPAQRHVGQTSTTSDSTKPQPTPYVHAAADSALRDEMKARGGDRHYACPLKGTVSKKYDSRNDFKGVAITGRTGDKVLSVQSGVVLLADKGSDGFCTVVVRHSADRLSLYKCEGKLLKQGGDLVQAGEPLLTLQTAKSKETPTLQFALFVDGEPVNPATLIDELKKSK